MRSSDPAMVAARASPNLVSRDFIRIAGRNRSTGAIQWANFWTDIGTVNAPVLEIDTGASAYYDFVGSGSILDVDDIAFVCEQSITIANQTVTLSHITQEVLSQIMGYDLHEQQICIYQGDFDPVTRQLVSPAESVFSGIIDTVDPKKPEAGGLGSITIKCRSDQSEMTRTNTLTRSHASEILRDPTDEFYMDTAVVPDWIIYWGQKDPKPIKHTNAIEVAALTLVGKSTG